MNVLVILAMTVYVDNRCPPYACTEGNNQDRIKTLSQPLSQLLIQLAV